MKKLFAVILALLLTGCSTSVEVENKTDYKKVETINFDSTTFENYTFPEDFNIRGYEGITLNFILENTIYANILSQQSEEFTKFTGININIRPIDYDTVMQKISLDLISQTGKYQVIYCDPYRILNRFNNDLEDLNKFMSDSTLPRLQTDLDDFFQEHYIVCSNFEDNSAIYSIPFDSTTIIFYYRQDIFDEYGDEFYKDMGYDWTPGTKEFTWDRYVEVSRWIDENVPDDVVAYGSGQMAKNHNSIMCEFSNVLASNGGDYFLDDKVNTYGIVDFSSPAMLTDSFIKSLQLYKDMVKVAAPESLNWYWADSVEAFSNGKIAMMANWDENYSSIKNNAIPKVSDNVRTSILPYGDSRSANIYGGTGIGINKYASQEEKEAAWFFITWATNKSMQLEVLKHNEGGGMPTIRSAYEDEEIKQYLNGEDIEVPYSHMKAVLAAWEPENVYLRPKIGNAYEVEMVINNNLWDMINQDLDPEYVARKMYSEIMALKEWDD